MMYGSPKHQNKHHQHPQQYQSWDSSNGYGVYDNQVASMPVQRPELQQYQHTDMISRNYFEDYVLQNPRRTPVAAYERPAPQRDYSDYYNVNSDDYKVAKNIDAEADEFIKLEHTKFLRLKSQFPAG